MCDCQDEASVLGFRNAMNAAKMKVRLVILRLLREFVELRRKQWLRICVEMVSFRFGIKGDNFPLDTNIGANQIDFHSFETGRKVQGWN